jgi:replicative DNA helicase
LNILTEGPAAGEIYEFMGRSFSGKSLVATNIMANNPEMPMIFFSLEMPARQALTRLYATYENVDHHSIQDQVKAGSLPRLFDDLPDQLPFQIIVDRTGMTLDDMSFYMDLYETYYEQRPSAVLVDYLELIRSSDGEGHFRTEMVAKRLKDWSKSEDTAVFLLHQTNRTEPEWDPPTADSARGAGYTEADVVVGMWQPSRNPKLSVVERAAVDGEIHMNVLKNRINGRTTSGAPIRLRLEDTLKMVDLSAEQTKRYYT